MTWPAGVDFGVFWPLFGRCYFEFRGKFEFKIQKSTGQNRTGDADVVVWSVFVGDTPIRVIFVRAVPAGRLLSRELPQSAVGTGK